MKIYGLIVERYKDLITGSLFLQLPRILFIFSRLFAGIDSTQVVSISIELYSQYFSRHYVFKFHVNTKVYATSCLPLTTSSLSLATLTLLSGPSTIEAYHLHTGLLLCSSLSSYIPVYKFRHYFKSLKFCINTKKIRRQWVTLSTTQLGHVLIST